MKRGDKCSIQPYGSDSVAAQHLPCAQNCRSSACRADVASVGGPSQQRSHVLCYIALLYSYSNLSTPYAYVT